jgi:AraC-like DNA-binding protein
MRIKQQHYFGETVKEKKLEDFFISITSYEPQAKVAKHFHEKPYLCFLLKGFYEEKNHKTATVIQTGTTLFRPANYEHSNDFSNHNGLCLNVEINNPEEYIDVNGATMPISEDQQKGSINVFKLLYAIRQNAPEDLLNIYCYESITSHFDFLPIKGKLDWVHRIKEQIRDTPFTSISLLNLSKEFNLHPNYIVRKFKEVTGYKLSDYLNKTRIEHSLNRLLVSKEKLTEVAYNTGFYDQSHYNKNFIKHFGISPKEFRKVIKG